MTNENTTENPAKEDYQSGIAFLEKKEYSQAANAFHNARIGFEEAGDQEGLANTCFRMNSLCTLQNDHERALDFLQQAEDIIKAKDDLMSMMAIRKQKVINLRGLKRYEEATTLYLDMLDIYQGLNNPKSAVDILLAMSDMYEEMGEKEKAADACNTAAGIHANFNHSREAEALREKAKAILNPS